MNEIISKEDLSLVMPKLYSAMIGTYDLFQDKRFK